MNCRAAWGSGNSESSRSSDPTASQIAASTPPSNAAPTPIVVPTPSDHSLPMTAAPASTPSAASPASLSASTVHPARRRPGVESASR